MKSEKERLLRLLNDGKLSSNDFEMLSSAIDKKTSPIARAFNLLINPFVRIAGFPALAIGFVIMLAMSFLGFKSGIHFPGVFDLQLANVGNKTPEELTFVKLILQNLVSAIMLGLAFYGASVIAKVKGLRIQDFIGTVMLSRFPYLIATLGFSVLLFLGTEISSDGNMSPSTIAAISIIAIGALVWQSVTYFFAFKESSGLAGKSLWVSFFVAAISAEVLSAMLIRTFLIGG